MLKIIFRDRVTNDEILRTVGECERSDNRNEEGGGDRT